MKKGILLLIVVVSLLLAVYLLIPSQVTISKRVPIQANQNGVVRLLTDRAKWQRWWPGNLETLRYDSTNFLPQQELVKTAAIKIQHKDSTLRGILYTVSHKPDLSSVLLQIALPANSNPVQKVSNYLKGKKIESEVDAVLNRLQAYAQQQENVYGLIIRQEKVKDSVLIATRFQSLGYPDLQSIYTQVEALQAYIKSQGAQEKDFPMLHATSWDGKNYEVMIAIPVDKVLSGNHKFELKRMVLGNILAGEVKGGVHTVQLAMTEMTRYVNDHHRTSPAMPFESLVTNRLQEPDTAKWVTKIYYPVI